MVKYRYIRDVGSEESLVTMEEGDFRLVPAKKGDYSLIDWIILTIVYTIWMLSLPLTWCISFKVVPQYQRILVFRLGRLLPVKGPGLIYVIPLVDRWLKTDMRMRAFSVPPHEILTIDGRQVKVGADVQYRIADPIKAHGLVQDLDNALRVSAQSVLNKTLACRKAAEIEMEKSLLGVTLQNSMNAVARMWGIEIARFEITQVLRDHRKDADDEFQDPMQTIVNLVKGLASQSSSTALPFGTGITTPMLNQCIQQQTANCQQNKIELLKPVELFEMLRIGIDKETAREIGCVFVFDISGENGGKWFLDLKSDPYIVGNGTPAEEVDVTFRLSDKLFTDILYQKVSPSDAYFTGKLALDGSPRTALKLETLVDRIRKGAT